ncbi:MAG: TIGR02678 family protein [Eubacteriaceae bacterium]|jgi:uncharacterized protein (TIGR02678 family)|nr:hypothetical protein [Eubacteriaceae bacterium]MDK2936837.1 hypothetical protein [Eubacteriaceae bacterium]MDK2961635.1 hypothetical protein [Eubacteriaceae bacterium]
MKGLEVLLDQYWIIKNDNKALFYQIKDSIPEYRSFLSEKLGYGLVMNQHLIKLEKIPGAPQAFMGIQEFTQKLEYILLCQLLMFLEDRSRDEQFVLSQVTEFIVSHPVGHEKIDWTLFSQRKSFVKVLRFVQEMGMIKVNDGDDQKFAQDLGTEVLYESTGISRYFARQFTTDIMAFSSHEELSQMEWGDLNADRGVIRRHRVYRKLLMEPVVYSSGADDADYDYIKKQRGMIEDDFASYLSYPLQVHKNGALLLIPQEKNLKDLFPNSKVISDIVLLFCKKIRDRLLSKKLELTDKGGIRLSRPAFDLLVKELKEEEGQRWSKEYREMTASLLSQRLIAYMEDFKMLAAYLDGREIEILPIAGKLTGDYPEEVKKSGKTG